MRKGGVVQVDAKPKARLRNPDVTDIRSCLAMSSVTQSEVQTASSYLPTFWKMHLPWTMSFNNSCCYKGLHLRLSDLCIVTPETFNHRNN